MCFCWLFLFLEISRKYILLFFCSRKFTKIHSGALLRCIISNFGREWSEHVWKNLLNIVGTCLEHFQNTFGAWFEYAVSSSSFQIAGFAVVVVEGEKGSSWTRTCMHHSSQSPSWTRKLARAQGKGQRGLGQGGKREKGKGKGARIGFQEWLQEWLQIPHLNPTPDSQTFFVRIHKTSG